MTLSRKKKLLGLFDSEIANLETLHRETRVATWGADEATFSGYRKSALKLLQKVYKGNVSNEAKNFNDEIDGGSAVVYQRLPNGKRDSRNHNSMFKPKIASAIMVLQEQQLELESKSLTKLRWTKKKWLTALWSFITLIVLTLVKELPDIIKAFRSK